MFFAKRLRLPAPLLQRLDVLYFALAAFDLITVCTALLLNHIATTRFERAVFTSADLSRQQTQIIDLIHLAQRANAPGNDVFQSRQVAMERERHEGAMARFDAALAQTLTSVHGRPDRKAALTHALRDAESAMRQSSDLSRALMSALDNNSFSAAAATMAEMDRAYGQTVQHLDHALSILEEERADHLQRQLQLARRLRILETVVALAVCLIVVMVAFYGRHISRIVRQTQQQRATMLGEVAAGRERLQHYADDVSHELRAPISKLRLEAEIALRIDRAAGDYRKAIESILTEAERLSTIVESLLFLARAENTQVALRPEPLNARKELEIIRDFFAAAAEAAQIRLTIDADEDAVIWADRSLLQRAVSNLVSNALENTPHGGAVMLRAAANTQRGVSVEVKDTGKGIAPQVLPHVFDRFRRGVAGKPSGLGLGLAITKGIMELHRGTVHLQSPPQQGVIARLFFPSPGENYDTVIS